MRTQAIASPTSLLLLVARTLLVATFVWSAVRHALDWNAALDEMGHLGMPRSGFLLAGSIGLRFLGGVLVLTGFRVRWGAALLLAFIAPATFLGHAFWRLPPEQQPHETIEFLNNLSMTGGVLIAFLMGSKLAGRSAERSTSPVDGAALSHRAPGPAPAAALQPLAPRP